MMWHSLQAWQQKYQVLSHAICCSHGHHATPMTYLCIASLHDVRELEVMKHGVSVPL